MTPVWLGQLLTSAKSFGDNPILGSRRLNELGLHAGRVALAHRLAAWRRSRVAHLVSPEDRADFARDGFVIKHDVMPAAAFEALVAQVKAYRGIARETIQGDALTRRIALDHAVLDRVPALHVLRDLPAWRGLVRYVGSANAEPIVYLQTILSHVVEGADPDPQLALHADTFHPSIKAWLFLTDVPEDDGPFVYVPGSHRLTEQRLAWERRMSIDIHDQDRL
ncbi:MAG: phytanoyl-CoA dioxygenase family protein, partial [Proteobacteria bacterium]|nr:phytanoyl-CoA dioxygenase family protein [Pseudomonadota bacterium]